MKTRNNILLASFTLIFILLITIGVSYAYFTANMSSGEETTSNVRPVVYLKSNITVLSGNGMIDSPYKLGE